MFVTSYSVIVGMIRDSRTFSATNCFLWVEESNVSVEGRGEGEEGVKRGCEIKEQIYSILCNRPSTIFCQNWLKRGVSLTTSITRGHTEWRPEREPHEAWENTQPV